MSALYKRVPANPHGRDYIVGDLHGCLDLLGSLLSRPLHGRLLENKFLACERSKRLQPYIRPVDAGV